MTGWNPRCSPDLVEIAEADDLDLVIAGFYIETYYGSADPAHHRAQESAHLPLWQPSRVPQRGLAPV